MGLCRLQWTCYALAQREHVEAESNVEDDSSRTEPGLLTSVVRLKWLVALLVVLGAVIGYVYALQSTPLYQATSSILLADPRTQTTLVESRQAGTDPGRYVRNQARVVTSQPVLELAAENLGVPPGSLGVSAEAQIDVDAILITAVDPDPQRAAVVADAVAVAYEEYRTEQTATAADEAIQELIRARQEIEQQLVVIEQQLADDPTSPALLAQREAATQQLQILLTRERQLSVDTALFGGGVELIEASTPPASPFEPRPLRNAAAGALLSFAYSSAGAWWWNRRRPNALAKGRMDRILKAPLLGEIPSYSRSLGPFPSATAPLSPEAEAYQFLLAAVSRAMRGRNATSLLITSASPGEGKTSTAINLAVVGARTGHRLVLVDGDIRVRGLTSATGVEPALALQDIVRDGVPIRMALGQPKVEGLESLSIACPDEDDTSDDPAIFLRSAGFGHAVGLLGQVAETVLIDSPPVLAVADTFEMIPRVDAVLLVVSPWTSEDTLEEVRRRLDLAGAKVLGYVLNRTEGRKEAYVYGGGTRQRRPGRAADPEAPSAAGSSAAASSAAASSAAALPVGSSSAASERSGATAPVSEAATTSEPVVAAASVTGSPDGTSTEPAPAPDAAPATAVRGEELTSEAPPEETSADLPGDWAEEPSLVGMTPPYAGRRESDRVVRNGSTEARPLPGPGSSALPSSHDVGWPRHAPGG